MSARSLLRDYQVTALPRGGYGKKPPAFPLPKVTRRESQVWAEVWKTPQAVAWAGEPWRWRTVGQYVRWSVRMEEPDASASLGAVVMRLADQIGLTPAGLRENGWKIAADELAARRAEEQQAGEGGEPAAAPPAKTSGAAFRQRMQAVPADGG
jgi:hypothetical protein